MVKGRGSERFLRYWVFYEVKGVGHIPGTQCLRKFILLFIRNKDIYG